MVEIGQSIPAPRMKLETVTWYRFCRRICWQPHRQTIWQDQNCEMTILHIRFVGFSNRSERFKWTFSFRLSSKKYIRCNDFYDKSPPSITWCFQGFENKCYRRMIYVSYNEQNANLYVDPTPYGNRSMSSRRSGVFIVNYRTISLLGKSCCREVIQQGQVSRWQSSQRKTPVNHIDSISRNGHTSHCRRWCESQTTEVDGQPSQQCVCRSKIIPQRCSGVSLLIILLVQRTLVSNKFFFTRKTYYQTTISINIVSHNEWVSCPTTANGHWMTNAHHASNILHRTYVQH